MLNSVVSAEAVGGAEGLVTLPTWVFLHLLLSRTKYLTL